MHYKTSLSSSGALLNAFQSKLTRPDLPHDHPHSRAQGQRVLLSENPNYLKGEGSQDGGALGTLSPKAPNGIGESHMETHDPKLNFFDIGKVSGKASHRTNPYS